MHVTVPGSKPPGRGARIVESVRLGVDRLLRQNSDADRAVLPSNRTFGGFFTGVFALGAILTFFGSAALWAGVLLAAAAVTGLTTLIAPERLTTFNRLWLLLGLALGRIVSPIVLGAIFYLLLTPVSLVTRAFGRDALSIGKRTTDSYWINRTAGEPAPESFRNQY